MTSLTACAQFRVEGLLYPRGCHRIWEPLVRITLESHTWIAHPSDRAISRDPAVYPNPDKFDPQRWLTHDGKVRDDLKFPSFGFGRR